MNEDGQGVYAMRTKEIVNSLCMIHAYDDPLAVHVCAKQFVVLHEYVAF